MKDLITIKETEGGKQAVSAKELHSFLNTTSRFRTWIKRMMEYGFTQDVDYQCLHKNVRMPNGGVKPKLYDYVLTLDTAKEIAMIQRTPKGKEARQYFIEVEKKYRNSMPKELSRMDLIMLAKESEEERLRLEEENKKLRPKGVFTDAVVGSKSSCLVGELAKLISQNGYDIGQNRLFKWMRDNNYLGKQGSYYNVPNQRYIDMGLFEIKKGVRTGKDGVLITTKTTKVKGKGQVYFINKFLDDMSIE